MATEKNITMKQFNGTDYDTLYPKTLASQIPDVYSKSQTYPQSQLYTRSQLYTQSQIDSMINSINTALDGKARIQTGSYVGTGTYGESNPCSLTFDFVPKWIIIIGRWASNTAGNYGFGGIIPAFGLTNAYTSSWICYNSFWINPQPSRLTYAKLVDKTVYWYSESNADEQFNYNYFGELSYYYIAFG